LERVAEGKTKIIYTFPITGLGLVKSKDIVSWGNEHKAPLEGKGCWSTVTTACMFRILKARGRDVAFEEQVSMDEFTAPLVDMVEVEAVYRVDNGPRSSFHKRNPDAPLGKLPEPVVELFLKTTEGKFGDVRLPEGVPDDPLIVRSVKDGVFVHHPAKPVTEEGLFYIPYRPNGTETGTDELLKEVAEATAVDGQALSEAWAHIGWNLSDVKLEYGLLPQERNVPRTHRLMLADVVDNDSWRLQDENGVEHSKQTVRDKGSVECADEHYALVAARSNELLRKLVLE
jgi:phosphoribosylaminoimidazole-succinocarboxamide synthase